jgi:EmrB/QacA subfamily drug resistance transporter
MRPTGYSIGAQVARVTGSESFMQVFSGLAERVHDGNAKWYTLAISVLALFMAVLDNLVVNVALPTISEDLSASPSQLQWILSAYVLVFASTQITAGGLGDRFGRKKFFIAGVVLFTATSAMAAFVQSTEWLIIARAAQGIGAAFIMPLSLSLISAAFPPEERGKALGIWSAVSMSGLALGPIIGGFIVEYWTWHWIFLINVPIGILTILAAQAVLRESRDESGNTATDIPGTLVVTGAIAALTWGLIEAGERGWGDSLVVGALIASLALFGLFVVVEHRSANPMVPLRFFKSPTFTGGNLVALMIAFLISGIAFSMTLYYQNVHGYSAIQTGLTMLPLVVSMMVVATISGSLVNRFGGRAMIALGMVISGSSMFLFLRSGVDATYVDILPGMVALGIGNGLIFAPMTTAVLNSVETGKSGVASAVNGAIRETGFAFGVALLGTIMNQTYQQRFDTSSEVLRMRDTSNPAFAPLQPVLDQVHRGINFAGRLIENPAIFPGLPPEVTEPIRIASSRAFISGMDRAFIISGTATILFSVVAWLLIRDEVAEPSVAVEEDNDFAVEPTIAD